MAPIGHRVVAVVGKVDLAHTKVAVQSHHVRLLQQRHGAFEVEADGNGTPCAHRFNIGHACNQRIALWMGGNRRAIARDHRHDLRKRIHVHSDIDRNVMHPRFPQTVNRGETGLRVQRQAGVGFPVNHSMLQIANYSGRSSLELSSMVEKVSFTPLMPRMRSITESSSSVDSVVSMAHRS